MAKLTLLYGEPTDRDEFDAAFREHLDLAAVVPDVLRIETARVVVTGDGTPSPWYRVGEIWFRDLETLQAAMSGPEGGRARADLGRFCTGGVTMLVSEID